MAHLHGEFRDRLSKTLDGSHLRGVEARNLGGWGAGDFSLYTYCLNRYMRYFSCCKNNFPKQNAFGNGTILYEF